MLGIVTIEPENYLKEEQHDRHVDVTFAISLIDLESRMIHIWGFES